MVVNLETIKQRYASSGKTATSSPALDKVKERYSNEPVASFVPEKGKIKLDIKKDPLFDLSKTTTTSSTPATTSKRTFTDKAGSFIKDVAQGIPRSFISYGKTIGNIASPVFNTPKNDRTQIKNEVVKTLLGEDDILSLEAQSDEFSETFKRAGVPERAANIFGPLAVAGFTAADIVTGGGKKELVEESAKRYLGQKGIDIIGDLAAKFDKGAIDSQALAKSLQYEFPQVKPGILEKYAFEVRALKENNVPSKQILTEVITKEFSKNTPPPGLKEIDELIPPSGKERKFIDTMKESPRTRPEVADVISSRYNPLKNSATLKEASDLIETSYDEALALAEDVSAPATAKSNAVSQLLITRAQNEGRFTDAIRLVETTAARATAQGQAIQALSMWNRLSPEGILKYTQHQIVKANKSLPPGKQVSLTEDFAKKITDMVKKTDALEDGEEKAVQTALMLKEINDLFPATLAKKLSTYQTMAQLLNPKTFIRNLGGNTGFAALEQFSDVVAAGLDTPLSLLTGKRTTSVPSLFTQSKGFQDGLRQGVRDALQGIDTLGARGQFDLPQTPVFKNGVAQKAEKLLNLTLKAPDRAFFTAAYDGSLYKQMKAAGVDVPTEDMREIAFHEGLYRTFQDDTALSYAFATIKKALNFGKEFGIGDIILKYPKTPANLLNRGLAYSPAGFMRTAYLAAEPLMGKTFDQKKFVESFGRATVGTGGLVGTGALFHRLGIITGRKNEDKDINALQQETGLGQYRINVSALKRFVLSGMDPDEAKLQKGDTLVSYDWFQPAAMPISIGANIDEGATKGSLITTMVESMTNGVDTLAEQPLISNLTRLLKYGDASDAVVKTAQQIPQTFIPTLLNQVRQLTDNTRRNVYDPDVLSYAFNLAKNKIPGASRTLPPLVGPFGNDQQIFKGNSNNLFNVFFNPAFTSKYKPSPEAQLVLDLFNETGETKQAPRVVSNSQTINGQQVKLTPTQVTAMQRFTGTLTRNAFYNLAQNPAFKALPQDEQVKMLQNQLTDIGSAARIVILGNRPKTVSKRVQAIIGAYAASQQGQ